MIDRARKAAALAVLVKAYQRYGCKAFKVAIGGENHRPLKDAEKLDWCWFVSEDRCGILPAGYNAVASHLGLEREPHALVSYQCQACGRIVGQPDDGRELPETVRCPDCADDLAEVAAKLRGEAA